MSPEQLAILRTERTADSEPSVAFELTPFAPITAAAITGASGMYQKVLRKRGYVHHTGEHARYDVFGLASLMVLRMMSERGGPKLASNFAMSAAYRIAWHALTWNHSWAGDHERALTWDPVLAPRIEAWQAATATLRHRTDWHGEEARTEARRIAVDPEIQGFNGWKRQSLWLRERLCRLRGFRDVPAPKFCVWAPDGRTATTDSLDQVFAQDSQRKDGTQLLRGPVVVLDVEQLGWTLLKDMKQVTGREFVTVHIAPLKGKQP